MSAPTILQKAVTPQMAAAYVRQGLDRVAGYVVRAAEVASVTSTADLIELHGLTFESSPFRADQPVHVLHLPQPASGLLLRATGGTTPEQVAERGGGFLERPPFRGDGKAAVGDLEVDLMWLEHTRLTPGTRLWRFDPGADEPVLVGSYHGVVFGWQDHEHDDAFRVLPTRGMVGTVAVTKDGSFPCDVRTDDDGNPTVVTLVAYTDQAESRGFRKTKAGTWAKQMTFREIEALAENHASARWHGLPVRIIDEGRGEDGKNYVRLFAAGRDAAAAERLGMDKMDAGCYETTAPVEALTDIVRSQRVPRQWANERQLAGAAEGPDAVLGAAARPSTPPAEGERPLLNQVNSPMVGMPVAAGDGETPDPNHPLNRFAGQLQRIAQGVVNGAPVGWRRIRVLCTMVGNFGQVMVAATAQDGTEKGMNRVPGDVAKALAEMRHLSADPEKGTWFTTLVTVTPEGKLTMTSNVNTEPKFTTDLTEEHLRAEARQFPRTVEHTPEWLAAKYAEFGIDAEAEAAAGAEARAQAERRTDAGEA